MVIMVIPVVPARGGAEVALKIYKRPFWSIELACAMRQPSLCVRALYETGVLFHMTHLKLHFTLHSWQSSHSTLHTALFTLHSSHFTLHTLHTSHCALRTPHFTLHTAHFTVHTSHCTLRTPNVTLHSPHFTFHSPHFTLLTSPCFLHTPNFTLHTSRPTLHTAPFTPHTSSNLSSSHLIPPQLFSSHLFSYVMQAFMNHFPVLLLRNLHAPCASQARACVLCAKLLQCCCPSPRTWPARDPGAMQHQASTFLTQHIAPFTLHIWALFIWFHVVPYVSYVLLGYWHVIWAQLKILMRWSYFQLISALLHVRKVERNSCRFFCVPKGVDNNIFTILRSFMPSVDALHQIATASVNMV